eukprot:gnl/TRDRNA2_/TRDRNA2_188233_c0_seq1.p1 gnl/TRDRNA2_/TRDRNA2_188233_c0~~gnl/TRDRNA2_/TRDRNA2_188233_c0_seq1.p1  ORF type:complete len:223 (+),score=8.78 gnl/TRDRNA2_/TRDRNA2_188233_c0_seq1:85-753(+)
MVAACAILPLALFIALAAAHQCRDGKPLQCVPLSSNGSEPELDCLSWQDLSHHHSDCSHHSRLCCMQTQIDWYHSRGPMQGWQHMVQAGVSICMVFGLCWCCCCLVRHRWHMKDGTLAPISRSHVEKHFPEVSIDGQFQCVICLGDIEGIGRKLQCGHAFHSECILDWWTHVPRTVLECPTCRQSQKVPPVPKIEGKPHVHPLEFFMPNAPVAAEAVGHHTV